MKFSGYLHTRRTGLRVLLLLAILFLDFGGGSPTTVYAAAPSNDAFGTPTVFTDGQLPYTNSIDTSEATPNEVVTSKGTDPDNIGPCNGFQLNYGLNTVWYQYTPGSTGPISVDAIGTDDYDTIIAVWTGSEGSLNFIGCNDDNSAGYSELIFNAIAGTTYHIEVAQYNGQFGSPKNPATGGQLFFHAKTYDYDVDTYIGEDLQKSYSVPNYVLDSYVGVSGGPLRVIDPRTDPAIASIRLLYRNQKTETLSELMGVPTSQLRGDYWLPVYIDNADNDSQIRFTNTNPGLSTTVEVYIGNNPNAVYSIPLGPSGADRVRLAGVVGGPVHIVSTNPGVNILAGMRIIYKGNSSFDEIMALPTDRLADEYWFPFYNHNNVNLFTEVRIANPSNTDTNVSVYIGDTQMDNTSYPLPNHSYLLKSYPGVNGGPLRVVSDNGANIIASIRLLYRNKKTETLSELMGVPTPQLRTDYWLPVYIDDVNNNSQIRFTNTHATESTTVNVYLGNSTSAAQSIPLGPKQADRVRLPGVINGPVRIQSTNPNVNILAGMRIIYKGNSSYDEIMALPTDTLDDEYWFPFYNHNNINLFTEVRIALPNVP